MSGPTGEKVAAVYASCADRIVGIAQSLDDAQLATPVAGTPVLAGRRSGAQGAAPAWSDDCSPCLDLLSPSGPLRDTDVVE